MPAYIIKPDSVEFLENATAMDLTLPKLRDIINGDVEHVTILWNGKRAHMFVDEAGHLKGLPLNPIATALYHNNMRYQRGLPEVGAAFLNPTLGMSTSICIAKNHTLGDLSAIAGVAVFYPGSFPDWEPSR